MYFPKPQVKVQKYKSLLEQKIKEAAAKKPMEISRLATEIGMNESSLYKMFKTGSTKPATLEKIAAVLEIDAKILLQEFQQNSDEVDFTEHESKSGKLISGEKAKLFLSELPEKDAEHYIPYYDVEITAGRIELYFDDVDEIPEGYVYAPHYQGCVMCNVKGNSMYDLIYPGARLYVYHLPDRKYIDYGQIYLVVTAGLRVLKYIRKHPTDDTKVVLASHNPSHDTWDVEKVDILNLFLVKGFENQTSM